MRRHPRHADRGGDAGAGADGSLPALSRPVRRCGADHAGHHAPLVRRWAMNRSAALRIAVVGVSSLIGEAVMDELRARKLAFTELHALHEERNVGRPLADAEGAETEGAAAAKASAVNDVAAFDFSRVDLAFFCGRTALSQRYAEGAAA